MVKHLKKILSVTLAAAMFTAAVPAFAAPSSDNAAEDAAKRLIASQKYFYNPSSGINLSSENEYPETFDLRSADLDGSGVKKNYVTPVKNQGLLGSCWGFAANAASVEDLTFDAATGTITDCAADAEGELVIPADIDGVKVTAIGNFAFDGCGSITNISIPDGLTSIGIGAFYDCAALTSINIPDSVTVIDDLVFCNCESLTGIELPDGLTSIGDSSFAGCIGLTSINIPDSVTTVERNAFGDCGSLNIGVGESNQTYCAIDGVLFSKDKRTIVAYAKDKLQPEYTIPAGTESIGDYAFYDCAGLTGVTVPDGVTNIGICAFYDCGALENIGMPDSVITIGDMAFGNCESLTGTELPDSLISIGYSSFDGCIGLTSITIPDGLTSIGNGAFSQCGSLNISVGANNQAYCDIDGVLFNKDKTTIVAYAKDKLQPEYAIPDGVTSIGNSAFDGCVGLTKVTIPDSVTSIDDYAFFYCDSLTDVYYSGTMREWDMIETGEYNDALANAEIHCGSGVIVGSLQFDTETGMITGCDRNAEGELVIPDEIDGVKVTAVGDSAFEDCAGLTSVSLPESVINIGDYAFEGCVGLTGVTIPEGVKSIGKHTFYNCGALTSVTIPNSVTNIGKAAFCNCGSLNISVRANNAVYCDIDGVLFSKDKTTILAYAKDTIQSEYVIPDGTESIGDSAFSFCTGLMGVTIPDGVTNIGEKAFYDCTGLVSVTIPEGVKSIGDIAFYRCKSITSVNLPEGLTSIGMEAFRRCEALADISIPNSVTCIGSNAFYKTEYYGSENNWKNNVLYIGNCLIEAKAEINGEYKPESGTRLIADSAFANCRSLTSVNLPEGLINIGKGAFKRCKALTDISISNSVISIGEIAFSGCGSLNITVDANNSAYCDIDGVLFTKDKNTIVAYAKDIIQPEYAVPDDVTNIGNSAFAGCAGLTKVTIPDSVTRIDDSAFSSCKNLTDVYYSGTKREWNQIETGEYNSDLLSADINCSDGVIITPPEIDWIKAAVDPETNTVMFQVKLKDSRQLSQLEQAKLYVAEYDTDGRLLNVTLGESAGLGSTVIFTAKLPETDNYKIMLWDKYNIPLTDAIDDITAIQ